MNCLRLIKSYLLLLTLSASYFGARCRKLLPMKAHGTELECNVRQLAYQYALKIQPFRGNQQDTFDALQLNTLCGIPNPPSIPKQTRNIEIDNKVLSILSQNIDSNHQNYFIIDPNNGIDKYNKPNYIGNINTPFKTIHYALNIYRNYKNNNNKQYR